MAKDIKLLGQDFYDVPAINVPLQTNALARFIDEDDASGGEPKAKKQINFIDYDGTIVDSYTATEWASVTSLPNNPSHTGLIAQGWNWTKSQIDAQLAEMPDADIWVGQMYITASGDTEIDVIFSSSARLEPILTVSVNGTITVDWGDNTTPDTVTGTSLTVSQAVPHTYASAGSYTIKIHAVSGSFSFYGTSENTLLRKTTLLVENRVYADAIKSIRLGSGITNLGSYAFANCCSLASVTIPSGVTNIRDYTFLGCYTLASVTIPSGITNLGSYAFANCYTLASVTIPSGVTNLGSYAFANCYTLASVTIPSGVTNIRDYTFLGCYTLASVTIPSGVTNIRDYTFRDCSGMAEYHFKPTIPPILGGSVFFMIASDCKIYVPSASLEAYKTDDNWSIYARYMVGE